MSKTPWKSHFDSCLLIISSAAVPSGNVDRLAGPAHHNPAAWSEASRYVGTGRMKDLLVNKCKGMKSFKLFCICICFLSILYGKHTGSYWFQIYNTLTQRFHTSRQVLISTGALL